MFYLIRWTRTKEVAGIMNTEEALGDSDFAKAFSELRKRSRSVIDCNNVIRAKLIAVVGWNLQCGQRYWYWEHISQAEYETYRDLHEFKVVKRHESLQQLKNALRAFNMNPSVTRY